MRTLLLSLLLSTAFAQDMSKEATPFDYAKQAQEERIQNEKNGIELRKDMRKASGLKKGDPRLRKENEPYDQADRIMRPD